MTTKKGQAIRFNTDSVRSMGRASYGVRGIDLGKGDEVVALVPVPTDPKATILTITEKGYGKRSALEDYRKTARAAKGVINLKVSERTGSIVKSLCVDNKDSVILTTIKGMVIRMNMKQLRVMGRVTQGVRVVKLNKPGDKVSDVVVVPREQEIVLEE
jgi:DNA gyrase subunit A